MPFVPDPAPARRPHSDHAGVRLLDFLPGERAVIVPPRLADAGLREACAAYMGAHYGKLVHLVAPGPLRRTHSGIPLPSWIVAHRVVGPDGVLRDAPLWISAKEALRSIPATCLMPLGADVLSLAEVLEFQQARTRRRRIDANRRAL